MPQLIYQYTHDNYGVSLHAYSVTYDDHTQDYSVWKSYTIRTKVRGRDTLKKKYERVYQHESRAMCHEYVMDIARHKRAHRDNAHAGRNKSRHTPIAVGSHGVVKESRRTKRRRDKVTQNLRMTGERIGTLTALKEYGYITPKAPNLPCAPKDKYDSACSAWASEQRDYIERKAVLARYGYKV